MNVIQKYKRLRSAWRRRQRLLYPSPAEMQLLRIMGGTAITIDLFRDPRTKFPFTFVLSMGPVFKAELIQREVRIGKYYADFAVSTPYYKKAIECDGRQWHLDVVHEQERDEYFAEYGFSVLHIPASDLYHYPNLVHERVLRFLSS